MWRGSSPRHHWCIFYRLHFIGVCVDIDNCIHYGPSICYDGPVLAMTAVYFTSYILIGVCVDIDSCTRDRVTLFILIGVCVDIDNCTHYGLSICDRDQYSPWLVYTLHSYIFKCVCVDLDICTHYRVTLFILIGVCVDIDNCTHYGPSICGGDPVLARVACMKYCGFCVPPSTTTTTTVTTTQGYFLHNFHVYVTSWLSRTICVYIYSSSERMPTLNTFFLILLVKIIFHFLLV